MLTIFIRQTQRRSAYYPDVDFKCCFFTLTMEGLIHRLRYGEIKFAGYDEHGISTIAASDIYYFEAVLENDEKVIISRLYVPILKNKFGVR